VRCCDGIPVLYEFPKTNLVCFHERWQIRTSKRFVDRRGASDVGDMCQIYVCVSMDGGQESILGLAVPNNISALSDAQLAHVPKRPARPTRPRPQYLQANAARAGGRLEKRGERGAGQGARQWIFLTASWAQTPQTRTREECQGRKRVWNRAELGGWGEYTEIIRPATRTARVRGNRFQQKRPKRVSARLGHQRRGLHRRVAPGNHRVTGTGRRTTRDEGRGSCVLLQNDGTGGTRARRAPRKAPQTRRA